jgi:hypothetical protein
LQFNSMSRGFQRKLFYFFVVSTVVLRPFDWSKFFLLEAKLWVLDHSEQDRFSSSLSSRMAKKPSDAREINPPTYVCMRVCMYLQVTN